MLNVYRLMAQELGIKLHHSIGETKALEKVKEECELKNIDFNELFDKCYNSPLQEINTEETTIKQKEEDKEIILDDLPDPVDPNKHMKLVRVIVTCNDPSKAGLNGELRVVGNLEMDRKQFIPYGKPVHIPQIMLNALKEIKFNLIQKDVISDNNVKTCKVIESNAYNIQILPPLTTSELQAIQQEQLARK